MSATLEPVFGANVDATRPTNVLVVGVGGQGVIMVSKVMARIAQLQQLLGR